MPPITGRLKAMNDKSFREGLHRSLTIIHDSYDNGDITKSELQSTLAQLDKSISADMGEDFTIGDAVDMWEVNRSFPDFEDNAWDIDVRQSAEYGYDWYMGMSNDELAKMALKDPQLKKAYGLVSENEKYESLVRSRHAALSSLDGFQSNVGLFSLGGASQRAGKSANFEGVSFGYGNDPEIDSAINYVMGSTEKLENLVDELRRNNLYNDEMEKGLRSDAKKFAYEENKETMKTRGKDRYIDSSDEMWQYHALRKLAKGEK